MIYTKEIGKKTNSTYESEQITTINKSNSKSVSTNNSVIIVGDSVVKHLIGQKISKKDKIKIKTNPSDILIISSQVLERNRIFCLFIREQMT